LRDPNFTHVLLVTLPEATPVHEASQLQVDLKRAAIAPYAWVINQSFSGAQTKDPLLLAKAQNEGRFIREVVDKLATTAVLVPWLAQEPAGIAGLRKLFPVAPHTDLAKPSTTVPNL
jgi:arsenite-transporting ATPase